MFESPHQLQSSLLLARSFLYVQGKVLLESIFKEVCLKKIAAWGVKYAETDSIIIVGCKYDNNYFI